MIALNDPAAVVSFWRAAGPTRWFKADPAFDRQVRLRLLPAHEAAAAGTLDIWQRTATGALALCILLDQAPRNMFRGTPRAFATDAKARAVAHAAIANGMHRRIAPPMRAFFFLPFEHSESLEDQHRCVALFAEAGDADGLRWAEMHRDIIASFGRFPHRNRILDRETQPEEQRFLDEGGFVG
jgi:uncharacterized protein (DUF924 family)